MRRTIIVWMTILLFAGPQQLKAGWVISEQSSDAFGNKSFYTTFIQDSIIRFDKPTSTSIINFNRNLVTLIFAQHRAYWRGTATALNRTTTQMAEQQMQKLLAYAPANQKERIKQALERFKKIEEIPDSLRTFPEVTVKKTGKTDTIIGYPAAEYEITIDSVVKQHIWVTHKIKPYHKTDIDRIMTFSKAINPFAIENSLSHSKDYLKLLENGFILKSVNFTSDGNKLVTQVNKIRKMNIPVAIFQIPAGYMKTTIENVMMLDTNNNILNPKNLSPDGSGSDDGLPKLPHNNNDNSLK